MTAAEWRAREQARDATVERVVLPRAYNTMDGFTTMEISLASDGGIWLQSGKTTDEGACKLRDWLLARYPR